MSLNDAERALVAQTIPMIKMLATRMAKRFRHVPFDDFISVGSTAAVFAARTFDPTRGTDFDSFAYKRISGAMTRDAPTEVVGKLHMRIARALKDYDPDARAPSELTLDEAMEDTPETAKARSIQWLRQQATESALGTLFASAEVEVTEDASERASREQRIEALNVAVQELDEQERYFVRRYYADDADLDTIANELQVVKRTVSRIHQRVKEQLEKKLRRAGIE